MAHYPPIKKTKVFDGEMRVFDWQPGNGTRYEVYLFITDEEVMISWRNKGDGGRTMVKRRDAMFHYSYMTEKMGIGEADAAALLALVAQEVGVEVALPPGHDHNGVWDGSEDSLILNDSGA